MTLTADAKINLSLDITGKRSDGYHDIVTEMQEIDLCDTVTVTLTDSPRIRVYCDNPLIPETDNIAYRAAEMFLRERGAAFGADIRIQKRIPLMSGLGGSSTDGAAVLKALNSLCGEMVSESELMRMGAALGADVPFCLKGGRAECRGIGDVVIPLPDLPPRYYVIVQPGFYCDTKSGYAAYDAYKQSGADFAGEDGNIFQRLYRLCGGEVGENGRQIDKICSELLGYGAEKAAMSGSGSAVYGSFSDEKTAKDALNAMKKPRYPYLFLSRNVTKRKG